MKKTSIAAWTALLILLTVAGSYTLNKVHADYNDNKFGPFLQALIEKFGLNENEVESFVEEQRGLRQQERFDYLNERLDSAVSEGQITQEQRDSLSTLFAEHRSQIGNEDLTMEERHELMETYRTQMHEWADQNGVNIYELELGWGGRNKGFGMGMHGF